MVLFSIVSRRQKITNIRGKPVGNTTAVVVLIANGHISAGLHWCTRCGRLQLRTVSWRRRFSSSFINVSYSSIFLAIMLTLTKRSRARRGVLLWACASYWRMATDILFSEFSFTKNMVIKQFQNVRRHFINKFSKILL